MAESQALPLQDPRQGDPHPRQGEGSRGQVELRQVAQHIDGAASLEEIAIKLGVTIRQVREALEELRKLGVVEEVKIIK